MSSITTSRRLLQVREELWGGSLSAKLRVYEQTKIAGYDFEQAVPGPKGEPQGGGE